jgi:hypothetical protein
VSLEDLHVGLLTPFFDLSPFSNQFSAGLGGHQEFLTGICFFRTSSIPAPDNEFPRLSTPGVYRRPGGAVKYLYGVNPADVSYPAKMK